jgi:hypothetical protein
VLGIVTARVIRDAQVAIVKPFDFWIVEPARATMPENNYVPTATTALQSDLGIAATEKACVVVQLCLLTVWHRTIRDESEVVDYRLQIGGQEIRGAARWRRAQLRLHREYEL